MGKEYQITGKNGSRELAKFLAANGQVILPMVELIEIGVISCGEFVTARKRRGLRDHRSRRARPGLQSPEDRKP